MTEKLAIPTGEQAPGRRRGTLPYPSRMIDGVCAALNYDDRDRDYVRSLFKRHEVGELTAPERLLPPMLLALASPLPITLTVSNGSGAPPTLSIVSPESIDAPLVMERVERSVRSNATAAWTLNCSLFIPSGTAADSWLLHRAASLVSAVLAREPTDRCEALLVATASLYEDMPQTWAAWNDASALAERRPPDEKRTFTPNSWHQINDWLCAAIDSNRHIVFLVPLINPVTEPDLPGPNDVTLSPHDLLQIADAASVKDGTRYSSGSK